MPRLPFMLQAILSSLAIYQRADLMLHLALGHCATRVRSNAWTGSRWATALSMVKALTFGCGYVILSSALNIAVQMPLIAASSKSEAVTKVNLSPW